MRQPNRPEGGVEAARGRQAFGRNPHPLAGAEPDGRALREVECGREFDLGDERTRDPLRPAAARSGQGVVVEHEAGARIAQRLDEARQGEKADAGRDPPRRLDHDGEDDDGEDSEAQKRERLRIPRAPLEAEGVSHRECG